MSSSTLKHFAAWLSLVEGNATPNEQPAATLDALLKALDGSSFFLEATSALGSDGGHRIRFSAYAPRGAVVKERTMHPVDAATTRAIELGGGKIKLHQPDPDANYQLRLQLDGIGTTNLPRILFNVGQSRELVERKGLDYHDIIPANFVLRIGPDRGDVLASIRRRDPELADVLGRLFELADRWWVRR